jgi:hypothetical protein
VGRWPGAAPVRYRDIAWDCVVVGQSLRTRDHAARLYQTSVTRLDMVAEEISAR